MSKIIGRGGASARPWQAPSVQASAPKANKPALHANLLTASQIEALQQQAYDEAYASGLAEGRQAGQAQVQGQLQQLDALMRGLSQPFAELDDQVERELVTLAIALLRQLVRREIKSDPGQVIAVVREAMASLPVAARNVRLHLHPEDASLVREALSISEEERSWRVVEDPVQSRGGCRVTTDQSQIDATLESRLAQVIAAAFGGERTGDRG